MNKVILIGRIAKDLDTKKSKNGKKFMIFPLAVAKNIKEKTADFINVIAWEQAVDYLLSYAKKGTTISVEGRLVNVPRKDSKLTALIVQSNQLSILNQPMVKNDQQEVAVDFVNNQITTNV